MSKTGNDPTRRIIMPTLPASVLVELDSTLIELRDVIQDLLTARSIVHLWPVNTRQRFEDAVMVVFDDVLRSYLIWADVPQTLEMQRDRVAAVIKHIGLTRYLAKHGDLLDVLIEPLAELVERPIRRQLADSVAKHPYHAWHVAEVKTTQFTRALIPGGIMVDLDRLQVSSGVVEIDLVNHWKHRPTAAGDISTLEPLGTPLSDDASRALHQEALGRSARKLYPRSK